MNKDDIEEEFREAKEKLKTESTTITSACILGVEVGTNCPKGGDWGHGGRTYIKLSDQGGVGWLIKIKDHYGNTHYFEPEEIEILLGGDAELYCIIKAMSFAIKTLRKAWWENTQRKS